MSLCVFRMAVATVDDGGSETRRGVKAGPNCLF